MGEPPRRNNTFTMTAQSKLNLVKLTDDKRTRIQNTMDRVKNTDLHDKQVRAIDPLQYLRITDELELLLGMTEQIIYGVANGTCVEENIALYEELRKSYKHCHCVRITYNTPARGANHEGHHIFNIIKTNGLYYVRDHSNNIDQQLELNLYFQQRHISTNTKMAYIADRVEVNGNANYHFNSTHLIQKLMTANAKVLRRRDAHGTYNPHGVKC